MKRFLIALSLCFALLLCICHVALAEQDFTFSEHKFTIFEGDALNIPLLRQGDALDGEVTWTSSNQKVATVDADGQITAIKKGSVTITAQTKVNSRTYKTTATVDILRAVTDLQVNEKNLTVLPPDDPSLEGLLELQYEDPEDERQFYPVLILTVNSETTISVNVTPSDASSTKVVLTADDEGELLRISGRLITPKAPGECILTVSSSQNPEIFTCYHVFVIQRVRGITVTPELKSIGVGGTTTASVTIKPDNATIKAVTWSTSTPKILSVSPDGTITALAKGTGRVIATATDGSKRTGEATISVVQMPESVTIGAKATTVPVGQTISLSATVAPNNTNDKTVTWTSLTPEIATVSSYGTVKGVSRGTASIFCSAKADPSVSEIITIEVTQLVEKVTADPKNFAIHVGDSLQLGWTIFPENASDPSVSFTSENTRIVSVSPTGVITGVGKGEAIVTIKAKDGSNHYSRVTVTVQQPVEGLSLKPNVTTVVAGRSVRITPTLTPSNANNKKVTWETTDPAIATVDANGSVKGIKAGIAVITCTSQDNPAVSAICTVSVVQLVTGITLEPSSISLKTGDSARLSWYVKPDDATDKSVIFTSNNTKVATVDPDGTIHAKARGECTVTSKAADGSGVTARIKVSVIQPVYGVHMRNSQVTVDVNGRVTIVAELEPSDASNTHMTWMTADPTIATVNGQTNKPTVKGVRWGDTVITGVTEDGGYATTCFVHVGTYAKALQITDLYLSANKIKMAVKNLSNMNIERFYFTVEAFDIYDNPLTVTTTGMNWFNGYYLDTVYENETTNHGRFHFDNFLQPETPIGKVIFTLTGYRCDDGFTYNYKLNERPSETFVSEMHVGPQQPDQEEPSGEEGGETP